MDLIIEYAEPPKVTTDKPFAMIVTLLDKDPYLGRC